MSNDKDRDATPPPRDDHDVYKEGRDRAGDRGGTIRRATRNMTDLMVGVSNAMAEGARTFGDTVRDRATGEPARPTDLVEATALSASRVFAALADTWQGFYDSLVRDHDRSRAAPAEPIDYERLAELVAAKLRDKPTK